MRVNKNTEKNVNRFPSIFLRFIRGEKGCYSLCKQLDSQTMILNASKLHFWNFQSLEKCKIARWIPVRKNEIPITLYNMHCAVNSATCVLKVTQMNR